VTRIVRAGDLIGMPVITLDGATLVGEVRDVLFDPGAARLVGFTLRGRGLLSPPLLGVLPAASLRSIGRDAVMIDAAAALIRDGDKVREHVAGRHEAPGSQVLTEAGERLGTITDVVLELGRGQAAAVVGYCLERDDGREVIVPVPAGAADWQEALVLPAHLEEQAAEGLLGFGALLERGRAMRSDAGT
jgi:uncharacterized protein YrrD